MLRAFLRSLLEGPVAPQLRRFVVVGVVAAAVQMALLWLFVDRGDLNYLFGALLAIEITIVLSYVANNEWTFRGSRKTTPVGFVRGLLKTNVVRGTAIPIQLAVLFALVEWFAVQYLLANGVGIVVSGVYRFALDKHWTWG